MKSIITEENHFLRKLYRKHLSRLKIFSPLKNAFVKFIFYYNKKNPRRNVDFISISDYATAQKVKKHILISRTTEIIPFTTFYKPKEFSPKQSGLSYQAPECAAYEVKNALVIARTDFLYINNILIHDDNYSPDRHTTTLDQFNIGKAGPNNTYNFHSTPPSRTIEKGISLISGGAGNYAHFMTEVVPKLIAIDKSGLYDDYPLLVDGWIGRNLTEILISFNVKCRQIIALNAFEMIFVKEVIYITAPVFAPQDYRKNTNSIQEAQNSAEDICSYLFSSAPMKMVRDFVLNTKKESTTSLHLPKRVYLQRKPIFIEGVQYNSAREIINDREVNAILQEFEFECVDITTLNFPEQVELFRNAEVVVSPLGAALTNCIFCPPETVVIGLGAYYKDADYSYHARMIASLKLKYSVVLGGQYRESNKNPLHYSYFICTTSLRQALKNELPIKGRPSIKARAKSTKPPSPLTISLSGAPLGGSITITNTTDNITNEWTLTPHKL